MVTVYKDYSTLRPENVTFRSTPTTLIVNVPMFQKMFIYKFFDSDKNDEEEEEDDAPNESWR